ncbi:MAG: thioredoxin family protein [Bacteroidia bacterium]|nr:thioredoxin family protein [Bacteroidia bacterium]
MLKFILPLFVLLCTLNNSLQAQSWSTDFEAAKAQASEEKKAILLVFQGSDWCVPCIKLHKEVWETPDFEQFSKAHLVPVKVDFPQRKKNALSTEQIAHNESLAENYNPQGVFPFVVITNASGKVLGETGYKNINVTAYLDHLNSFIQ